MADADLIQMPEPARTLPQMVWIDPNEPLRFTPKQLRILKAQTGRDFASLLQEELPVVQVWFKLRREGWPELRYADLEDVMIEVGGTPVDPLNVTPPTGSPPSAGSGA